MTDGPPTRRHLRRAIRLAMNGRGRVEPNPMVGCVIVKRRPRHRRGLPPAVRRPPRRAERAGRLHRVARRGDGVRHARAVLPHGQEDAAVRPAADRRAGRPRRRRLPRPQPGRQRRRRADAPRGRRRSGRAGAGGGVRAVDRGVPEPAKRGGTAIPNAEVGRVGRPVRGRRWRSPVADQQPGLIASRSTAPVAQRRTSRRDQHGSERRPHAAPAEDLRCPRARRRIVLDTHLRTPVDSQLVRTSIGAPVVGAVRSGRRQTAPERNGHWSTTGSKSATRPTRRGWPPVLSEWYYMTLRGRDTHLLVEPGPTLADTMLSAGRPAVGDPLTSACRRPDRSRRGPPCPDHFVTTGTLDLDGDRLTEYLNTRSPAVLRPRPLGRPGPGRIGPPRRRRLRVDDARRVPQPPFTAVAARRRTA